MTKPNLNVAPLPAQDFTLALFCRIDDELRDVPKPKLARLHPSEVVTLGVLQVLCGEGWRPFYRWMKKELGALFPHLPEQSRLFRLWTKYWHLAKRFLAKPTALGMCDTFGIELLHPRREGRCEWHCARKGKSNGRWIVGQKTTSYLVDTDTSYSQVIEERAPDVSDAAGAPALQARYVWGQGLAPLAMWRKLPDGSVKLFFHISDGQESVRQLTDASGAVVDSYFYDAWGNTLDGSSNHVVNPFRYTGQQLDADGRYYLRARFYNPGTGRLLSHDPLMGSADDPASLHRYLYAGADGIDERDPSGKEGTLIETSASIAIQNQIVARGVIGGIIGGAAGAVSGAIDSSLSGGDPWAGASTGAALGFGTGVLAGVGTPLLNAILFSVGAIGGVSGAYLAYDDGNSKLAVYRAALAILSFGILGRKVILARNSNALYEAGIQPLEQGKGLDTRLPSNDIGFYKPNRQVVYAGSINRYAELMYNAKNGVGRAADQWDWSRMAASDDVIKFNSRGTIITGHHRFIGALMAGYTAQDLISMGVMKKVSGGMNDMVPARPWGDVIVSGDIKP